jgi:8-oxo-dGTP diphosphatase
MESFEECASRELKEETGIDIPPAQFTFAHAVNSVWDAKCSFDENGMTEGLQKEAHYATIFMEAFFSPLNKEPQTLEPHKCEGWMWVKYDNMPRPLFQPLARLLMSKGYRPPAKDQEDENCRKLETYEWEGI